MVLLRKVDLLNTENRPILSLLGDNDNKRQLSWGLFVSIYIVSGYHIYRFDVFMEVVVSHHQVQAQNAIRCVN
jgi:hypothetical protein